MHRFCHLVVSLFAILSFSSCVLRPFSVLSQDEMVDIVFDLQKAQSTIDVMVPFAYRSEKQEYFNSVFEKHDITREQFEHSVQWYSQNPKLYQKIYEEVQVRAKDLQTRVEEYEFHPEASPNAKDGVLVSSDSVVVDTVDIWRWRAEMLLSRKDAYGISRDSVMFSYIAESDLFVDNVRLQWHFLMRNASLRCDTAEAFLAAIYNDSRRDTIRCQVLVDSITRHYHFYYKIKTDATLLRIDFCFNDQVRMMDSVAVDSIRLYRFAEDGNNQLQPRLSKIIQESRDSCYRYLSNSISLYRRNLPFRMPNGEILKKK